MIIMLIGGIRMYECWLFTITESNRKINVWGEQQKVDEFKKLLGHGDFGGGFTGRPLHEVKEIVDSLKANHLNAIEISL
jgi:hypothetical protein